MTETEETVPPLDTFRRNSVGLLVTGAAALPAAAVPALSPAGLAVLGLMLAASALYLRRRMR